MERSNIFVAKNMGCDCDEISDGTSHTMGWSFLSSLTRFHVDAVKHYDDDDKVPHRHHLDAG